MTGGSINSRECSTLTSANSSNIRHLSTISEVLILVNSTSLVLPAGPIVFPFCTVITTDELGTSQPRRAAGRFCKVTGRWSIWTITSPLSSKPELNAGLCQRAGELAISVTTQVRPQGLLPADHHVIDHHSREHQPDLRTQPGEGSGFRV